MAAWHGLLYSVVNTTEESRGGIQRERSFIELLLYIRPITKWLGGVALPSEGPSSQL